MTKKMLIEATYPEETRVAIVENNRLIEFDYEVNTKKNLKGNIYLAKIIRVEPSLQAAFVDYGEERHGFLAFNEIHPDYYRIPISDRENLKKKIVNQYANQLNNEEKTSKNKQKDISQLKKDTLIETSELIEIETLGGESIDEIEEETQFKKLAFHKKYKIQEVIKRNQIILVQVMKEERGSKGAALTTYISLAGRYCVLMPNAVRSGGISRKITNIKDRQRLKNIIDSLKVSENMSLIIRTAGKERTKIEIKKDSHYLFNLWDEIRKKTLDSTAPSIINQEGNIIKRSIRDIYSKDIEKIIVEGKDGYNLTKSFMKTILPSHASRIKLYSNEKPLFYYYKIEEQIKNIFNPVVHLPSGGSMVINHTEALTAIDINSGKATRERHIEETAFKTNTEAAKEIAFQLHLRDIAGLIVIDFIDMEERSNIYKVEKQFKDSIRNDKARIQVGHISHFGLLELSRQRLRASIFETNLKPCPYCDSSGYVYTIESISLRILREIEKEIIITKANEISTYTTNKIAFHILNKRKKDLLKIESKYLCQINIIVNNDIMPYDFKIKAKDKNLSEIKNKEDSKSNKKFPPRKKTLLKEVNKTTQKRKKIDLKIKQQRHEPKQKNKLEYINTINKKENNVNDLKEISTQDEKKDKSTKGWLKRLLSS